MSERVRRPVPVRTIAAAIAMVLATVAAIYAVQKLSKILTWIVIAAFFAVILSPAVDFLERRAKMRRTLAALIVFVLAIGVVVGMLYIFIRPLVDQAQEFSDKLPSYVEDARNGQGTIGRLVTRYKLDEYVQRNQVQLREGLSNAGAPAAELARGVFSTIAALLSILVLTVLMLMRGPKIIDLVLRFIPPRHRTRVRRVAKDCNRAVTGYMGGNLLISIIAGISTYVFLIPFGVPFRAVLALFVAFADLIPLLGATLGAIAVVGVSFLHSPQAGIAALIFYVLYQQVENHVLQPAIMSRTVDLSPLAVLVSVLIGVELFGILGALLAIPVGGIIQVIARDIFDENLGMLKEEPTIGEDEIPLSQVERDEAEDDPAPPVHPAVVAGPATTPPPPASEV